MKRIISLLLILLVLSALLGGCAPYIDKDIKTDTVTVTDMLGRNVDVPLTVQRVVCIGAGALRLYSYIGDMTKLCGVEECEKGFLISVRPYQTVNEELFRSLPSVGAGGPQGAQDAEALLSVHPDVIFSLYTSDSSAADELQQATGIPVVVLSYGKTEAFDVKIIRSLTLMGKILGRTERADEVTGYIQSIESDLDNRTKDIPDSEKKTVYLGCQSNYGIHGIGSTTAGYSLFDAVNAKNVLDRAGYTGYQKALDLETVLTLNPDVMILDAGGLSVLREEYGKNKSVFDIFKAFRTGEVYLQMPYNAYYTNLETAYADAYYIGTVLYPEQFKGIDIGGKYSEISEFLLGRNCYSEVSEMIPYGYRKLDISILNGEQ